MFLVKPQSLALLVCPCTESSVVFSTRLKRKMFLHRDRFLQGQPSRTHPKADLWMVLDLSSMWDQNPVLR